MPTKSARTLNSPTEDKRHRVRRRTAKYCRADAALFRVYSETNRNIISRPREQEGFVQRAHEGLGHYKVKRTVSRVTVQHSWSGVYREVKEFVQRCGVCDRVQASFAPRWRSYIGYQSWACSIDGQWTWRVHFHDHTTGIHLSWSWSSISPNG